MAAAGGSGVSESVHERRQTCRVERSVLELDLKHVGPRAGHALAGFVSQLGDARVVDGLILGQQFDGPVYARHLGPSLVAVVELMPGGAEKYLRQIGAVPLELGRAKDVGPFGIEDVIGHSQQNSYVDAAKVCHAH